MHSDTDASRLSFHELYTVYTLPKAFDPKRDNKVDETKENPIDSEDNHIRLERKRNINCRIFALGEREGATSVVL